MKKRSAKPEKPAAASPPIAAPKFPSLGDQVIALTMDQCRFIISDRIRGDHYCKKQRLHTKTAYCVDHDDDMYQRRKAA